MSTVDTEHILEIVKCIRESNVPNKEEYFENRYQIFKKKYPQLYKAICTEEKFDMDNLRFMLNMLHNVQVKKETTLYNAEVQIGEMLFNKYVKQNVPNMKAEASTTCDGLQNVKVQIKNVEK